MIELWKDISGWPYRVSNTGKVQNIKHGHYLKPMMTGQKRKQYGTVRLCNKGAYIDRKVADLVLEAFVGPRPAGMLSLHSDDNSNNNNIKNLRWGTHRENGKDMVANGTHNIAILNEAQALEIRRRRNAGEKGRALAIEFGISEQTVCDIHKMRIWT